jgi:D-aminopeptidase
MGDSIEVCMPKARLRDLGIVIGNYPTGQLNSITDVPGVLVGQSTLITDTPAIARTGITAVFPRADIHQNHVMAAYYSFNGIGEMTGLPFIQETGRLSSPVLMTNTNQVGMVYDGMVRYGARKFGGFTYKLPVVAETYDGWLNDMDSFPLNEAHVIAALESAGSGLVAEGNSGGGTGMICYEFKGGTGTASRRVQIMGEEYTVGVLVQANHGERAHLRVCGVPVGEHIGPHSVPTPWPVDSEVAPFSSIIIIIATDAPLLADECRRLAQRGTVGLARTGGFGLDGSGDLFLAFSTGNNLFPHASGPLSVKALSHFSMDPLVIGTVEAVEEAILNVLVAAETMTGYHGHTAYALPHDLLVEVMSGK